MDESVAKAMTGVLDTVPVIATTPAASMSGSDVSSNR
jgi:hypothetical protein